MKNVQIPLKLFVELCKCFLLDNDPPADEKYIHDALEAKYEALVKREEYSRQIKNNSLSD